MRGSGTRAGTVAAVLASTWLILGAPPASGKRPAGADQICGTQDPPVGYEYEVGFGSGRTEAEARANALDDATHRLLDKVCAGLPPARCDGIRRTIRPWKADAYDRRSKTACAVVAFPKDVLRQMEEEKRRLEEDLALMALEVVAHGEETLHHQAPIWKSGCGAAAIGEYLQTVLDGNLGRGGIALVRDEGQARAHRIPCLRLELAPGSSDVTVTGYVRRPGALGETAVPGPGFALDLFGVGKDEVGNCLDDYTLGLDGGHRVGLGGLTVQVDLPGGRNLFDDGELIEPTIHVDRPAKVRVFSVLPDGRAWLIWPASGEGLIRDGTVSLGEGMVLETGLGDERIVAVAIAADASFGAFDTWTGFCRLDGKFALDAIPADAAIGTATYSVRTSTSGGDPSGREEYSSALDFAPACGG